MIYYAANDSDLAAIVTTPGDTVLLKGGATFSAAAVPASLLSPNDVTIGYYGYGGDRAIIDGGTTVSSWTEDAGTGTWFASLGSNVGGNVLENGVPMRFVAWNVDLATTAPSMTSTSIAGVYAGSFTFDPVSFNLYIKPSTGTPTGNVYRASATLYCLRNSTVGTGLTIEGLELRSASRHALLVYNRPNLRVSNVVTRQVGGHRLTTIYVGNGFEISFNTNNAVIDSCEWYDTFDSGATSQLYETSPRLISDHAYLKCKAARHGMHGIEISTHNVNNHLRNIEVNGFESTDASNASLCWSGDRSGSGVTLISTNTAENGGTISGCYVTGVTTTRVRRPILSYQTRGVNRFQFCTGSQATTASLGTRGNIPLLPDGRNTQRDLVHSVVDNFGAMSGEAVVSVEPTDKRTSWIV